MPRKAKPKASEQPSDATAATPRAGKPQQRTSRKKATSKPPEPPATVVQEVAPPVHDYGAVIWLLGYAIQMRMSTLQDLRKQYGKTIATAERAGYKHMCPTRGTFDRATARTSGGALLSAIKQTLQGEK